MSARLSDEDVRWLAESCRKSGVPEQISDPDVIARAARVLGEARTRAEVRGGS